MDLPIIYSDNTENEIEIDLCCAECAKVNYGWTKSQFDKIMKDYVKTLAPIKVPDSIKTQQSFYKWVATNL
jgi:hypothetical protein